MKHKDMKITAAALNVAVSAEHAVGLTDLSDEELQHVVGGYGGYGAFTSNGGYGVYTSNVGYGYSGYGRGPYGFWGGFDGWGGYGGFNGYGDVYYGGWGMGY